MPNHAGSGTPVEKRAVRTPGVREQMATRTSFLAGGLGLASWAPLVPYARDRLGLDDADLGLVLLCLGLGSMLSMPLTGILAGRFGCRAVIVAAAMVLAITLCLLAIAPNPFLLATSLFFFGASLGTMDVAINLQAVIVERAAGRAMMSGFHGQFSLGTIVGASGTSVLLHFGLPPFQVTLVVFILISLLVGISAGGLLPYGNEGNKKEPMFVVPHGRVVFIGLLCFFGFMTEGTTLDWSAIFLITTHGFEPSSAGIGYVLFSIAMTGGRLTGDRLVHAFGGVRVMAFGGVAAAAGFFVAIFAPWGWLAVSGFFLIGCGAANLVPVLFSAVGRQTDMPPGLAIAAISTFGYFGILVGPAMLGFIAHWLSLGTGFGLVAIMLLVVAANARIAAR